MNLTELEAAVVFIDEVEEIAGSRSGIPSDPVPRCHQRAAQAHSGVFRQHDERLLICATNSVRSLDSAFLRHGRFDYIIPVGPPDDVARAAIWQRYLAANADVVEVDKLVEASEMFTPADIEFAARKGAQSAFEREIEFRRGESRAHRRLPRCHRRHAPDVDRRDGRRVRRGHRRAHPAVTRQSTPHKAGSLPSGVTAGSLVVGGR